MSFKNVIGHTRETKILQGIIQRNRIPSSFLFTGVDGIGKSLIARNFVKVINCLDPKENDCCDRCSSCKKIDALKHFDIYTVENTEQDIKIDKIREIECFAATMPLEAKMKFIVIDNADRMNPNAQNAFLKTLEEPPKHCIIILITSSPDLLLDTIKSRCFQLRFKPLSMAESLSITRQYGIKQNFNLFIGMPGRIISNDTMDIISFFSSILDDMYKGEVKENWKDINEMKQWLELLIVFLRDLSIRDLKIDDNQLMLNLRNTQQRFDDVLKIYDDILSLYIKSDMNLNKKIVWNYVRTLLVK
ncbi:MAG TPA: DNA polymerase III subunit delta' [Nitrospirae bacterium]|nr:DNA polymerase III subunit delta' [Nitrospirota bacterium]